MVTVLNRMSFVVDVIDRSASIQELRLRDEYDLFVGISGGESSFRFLDIREAVPRARTATFVTAQVPEVFNAALNQRYDDLETRHPGNGLPRVGFRRSAPIRDVIGASDVVFCEGHELSLGQYRALGRPVVQLISPTSPRIKAPDFTAKQERRVLYFAGNRHVLKGLDLVLDLANYRRDVNFHICAPPDESEFWRFYDFAIRLPNVHLEGFVPVGSRRFDRLTRDSRCLLHPSAADSMATSVTTCMRRGLIPVVTTASDVPVDRFGLSVKQPSISVLNDALEEVFAWSLSELRERQRMTRSASSGYSEDAFVSSFNRAVQRVLTPG